MSLRSFARAVRAVSVSGLGQFGSSMSVLDLSAFRQFAVGGVAPRRHPMTNSTAVWLVLLLGVALRRHPMTNSTAAWSEFVFGVAPRRHPLTNLTAAWSALLGGVCARAEPGRAVDFGVGFLGARGALAGTPGAHGHFRKMRACAHPRARGRLAAHASIWRAGALSEKARPGRGPSASPRAWRAWTLSEKARAHRPTRRPR